jgi:hypothetical protein
MFSFRSEGLERHGPPPSDSLLLVPAGSWSCPLWRGTLESVHVLLKPQLLARVAAEACDLNPERVTLPVAYGLSHPGLRSAVQALHAELTAGGPGGRLLGESLGNVLAVHLLRQFVAPGQDAPRRATCCPGESSRPSWITSRHISTPR